MKLRVLNIIIGLFVTACIVTSCLGDDTIEYEYSSDSSITAFSIVDSIVTRYPGKTEAGKDTTLSTAVLGSDYPFIIDQLNGLIYNADSLPMGTDVSKVVVNITADTRGIYIAAETDSVWESSDSINFTSPVRFKVVGEDGIFGRIYTASINVHQQDPELLAWHKVAGNLDTHIQKQKAVLADNRIYVFAEQASQVAVTTTQTDDAKVWTPLTAIDIPTKADYNSAMAWDDKLYILADNELYTSSNGLNWTKVETEQPIARLLANIQSEQTNKIIGVDTENCYIESEDGIKWTRYEALPEGFPTEHTAFVSYPLLTNPGMSRIVLAGENPVKTDTTSIVWTQLDFENGWTELYPSEPKKACPNLANISLIHYNQHLYVFGGEPDGETFSPFYESKDNGITWETSNEKIAFPEEFATLYKQSEGDYSYVVDENQFIWMIWSRTGEVWKGRINQLGFKKQ